MEDDIDYGKDMTLEELENLEEVDIKFDKNARHVEDGKCPHCNERFVKVVESKNIGDWVTFHITKLKCPKCGEVYLDLNQGKKNDIIFMLEKAFHQPIDVLSKKMEKLV
jgi:formylmethanofuran dehydrogenase subunit E